MFNSTDIALQQYIEKVAKTFAQDNYSSNIFTGIVDNIGIEGSFNVKVLYQEREESIKADLLNSLHNFKKGDYVYIIKAPIAVGDSFNTKYYILGLVEEKKEALLNFTKWDTFKKIGGASYQFNDTLSKNNNFSLDFNNNSNIFIPLRNGARVIAISGNITFSQEINYNSDNFGIELKFLDEKENLLTSLKWGVEDFIFTGNRLTSSFQKNLLTIKSNIQLEQIKKIIIKTFNEKEGADLSVSSLEIQFGQHDYSNAGYHVKISAEDEKNYFINNKEEDKIYLQADVFNGAQNCSSEDMHYYWAIRDKSITEGSGQYYSDITGAGWRLLNDSMPVLYYDANGRPYEGQKTVTNKNSITLSRKDLTNQYEYIIKCLVEYGAYIKESDELKIYDLNTDRLSNISVSCVDKTGMETRLLKEWNSQENNYLILSVQAKIENLTGLNSVGYSWSLNNSSIQLPQANANSLQLYYLSEGEDRHELGYRLFEEGNYIVKCTVSIYNSEGRTIDTEEVEFSLYTEKNLITEKIDNFNFYCWATKQSYITFEEDSSEIGWSIRNVPEDEYHIIKTNTSSYQEFLDNQELYSELEEGEYYIFATWRHEETIKSANFESSQIVNNYAYPKLIRKIKMTGLRTIYDTRSQVELNQLSTFNQLTGGGEKQGIYYDKGDHGDLYLNASYINTGALTVGGYNSEGQYKKKFYANIENDEVEIANFKVSDSQIYNDTNGYISIGTEKIQLGTPNPETGETPFEVNKDGELFAKQGTIGGYEIGTHQLTSSNGSVGLDSRGHQTIGGANYSFWAGAESKDDVENAPFWVKSDGSFHATNAEITGDITATSLHINSSTVGSLGGVNLLKNTGRTSGQTSASSEKEFPYSKGWICLDNETVERIEWAGVDGSQGISIDNGCITFNCLGRDEEKHEIYYRFMKPDKTALYGLEIGKTYTLSGKIWVTNSEGLDRIAFRAEGYDADINDPGIEDEVVVDPDDPEKTITYDGWNLLNWTYPDLMQTIYDPQLNSSGVWKYFSATFTVPISADGFYFSLQAYPKTYSGQFSFKEMKLEEGTIATAWSANSQEIEGVTSEFIVDENQIKLKSKTLLLEGDSVIIDSTNFTLTEDGTITATAGEIGGCSIKDGRLQLSTEVRIESSQDEEDGSHSESVTTIGTDMAGIQMEGEYQRDSSDPIFYATSYSPFEVSIFSSDYGENKGKVELSSTKGLTITPFTETATTVEIKGKTDTLTVSQQSRPSIGVYDHTGIYPSPGAGYLLGNWYDQYDRRFHGSHIFSLSLQVGADGNIAGATWFRPWAGATIVTSGKTFQIKKQADDSTGASIQYFSATPYGTDASIKITSALGRAEFILINGGSNKTHNFFIQMIEY